MSIRSTAWLNIQDKYHKVIIYDDMGNHLNDKITKQKNDS